MRDSHENHKVVHLQEDPTTMGVRARPAVVVCSKSFPGHHRNDVNNTSMSAMCMLVSITVSPNITSSQALSRPQELCIRVFDSIQSSSFHWQTVCARKSLVCRTTSDVPAAYLACSTSPTFFWQPVSILNAQKSDSPDDRATSARPAPAVSIRENAPNVCESTA